MFKEFYEKLFEFKKATGNVACKMAINTLLGMLASKNYIKVKAEPITKIRMNREVVDGTDKKYITKNYKMSKYKYAPWFWAITVARGRTKINNLIDEIGREHVVCVMTDGIVVKANSPTPGHIGENMGELKLERTGTALITKNKKEWIEQ